jgi:hypothetical protein
MEAGAGMKLAEAARLLEEVACGTLSVTVAIQRWPFDSEEGPPAGAHALHALYHFQADADIRLHDERYAEAQVRRLRRDATELLRDAGVRGDGGRGATVAGEREALDDDFARALQESPWRWWRSQWRTLNRRLIRWLSLVGVMGIIGLAVVGGRGWSVLLGVWPSLASWLIAQWVLLFCGPWWEFQFQLRGSPKYRRGLPKAILVGAVGVAVVGTLGFVVSATRWAPSWINAR